MTPHRPDVAAEVSRATPRPCPCTACVGGCRMEIAARAPWTVCKSCGVHKRHRVAA